MKSDNVKLWLHGVTRTMLNVFARSNTYRALHTMYEELATFGTAATVVQSDFDTVIHHQALTAGEYAVATDARGMVDTLYREFEMTVSQIVDEFGLDNASQHVKNSYDRGSLDHWITVVHVIEPRTDRDVKKKDAMNMPYRSCYFEHAGEDDKMLRESGYEFFPALVPRWNVTGGDIYGMSPAMEALGDIKQLQHEQLRKAQGIDYQTKPPMQVPTALKNQGVNALPGGVTYVDTAVQNGGIRTAFEVNLNLNHLLEDINDVRTRISSSFYADLFLMLANSNLGRMTATEVAERHEEKLLVMGPVLERLHNELLDPLVQLTFNRMLMGGLVPPPPPEMQEQDIDVEFVSTLSQAQKAVGTNSVDRFVGNLGAIAQMKPEVIDKFDSDTWADMYSDLLGVDPNLIMSDDNVAKMRQERAQAQQQQAQAEQLNQGADTAQKLGQVKTQNGRSNAANDVLGVLGNS